MLTVSSGSHRAFAEVSDEASLPLITALLTEILRGHLRNPIILFTRNVAEGVRLPDH